MVLNVTERNIEMPMETYEQAWQAKLAQVGDLLSILSKEDFEWNGSSLSGSSTVSARLDSGSYALSIKNKDAETGEAWLMIRKDHESWLLSRILEDQDEPEGISIQEINAKEMPADVDVGDLAELDRITDALRGVRVGMDSSYSPLTFDF